MTGSTPTDDLPRRLAAYATRLQTRKDALAKIARTSSQMLLALERSYAADINALLDRRERECSDYAALLKDSIPDEPGLLDAAAQVAQGDSDGPARTAACLHAECKALAQQIIEAQNRCQSILAGRIERTARALRESAQRRRLGAAYGPTRNTHTPRFIDQQK